MTVKPKNTEAKASQTLVLEENQALSSYLDSLLQEIPDFDVQTEIEAKSEVVETLQAPVVEATSGGGKDNIAQDAKPSWGQSPFQCLLFKVAGLNLAVPLVKLNGIIPMPEGVTPMPGHAPWFLGLIQHYERKVKTVDVAPIVLPDGYQQKLETPTHIILIDDYAWGIACEGITETITLRPDDVRWRTSRGARAWLAGTVIKHMCAILDIDSLAASLRDGAWQIDKRVAHESNKKKRP